MHLTPINMAEAIIEPFWDGQLSGFPHWQVTPGDGHGLHVRQNWCWLAFEWARRPAAGPALSMSRDCDLDVRDYDDLLVSVMAPEGSVFRAELQTDAGPVTFTAPPAASRKKEHAIDLKGARRLRRITLEIQAAGEGVAEGWFNWLGLRHRGLLARYEAEWRRFDERWDGYLKPADFEPSFRPAYGFVADAAEFERLRVEHEAYRRSHGGRSPFIDAGQAAAATAPERGISDFVNFWWDTRYNRERDHDKPLLVNGPNAAIAGLLLRDKQLQRLAARYAMSIAMCTHWDDGMICAFPAGNWDHRCFVQSLCCLECALILDLCGEWFTHLGREVIMRRLAEEGLGNINYNSWRYEYIFTCNQLAWFTPGRLLAYLLLEKHWQHVTPYIDIAHRELVDSLTACILPDGGYVEGPTYFTCVGYSGGFPLYLYARSRQQPLTDTLPECMRRCADFGELCISTDDSQDVIPFCDAGTMHDLTSQAIMATALPQSAWTRMFRRRLPAAGGDLPQPPPTHAPGARPFMLNAFLAWVLASKIPAAAPAPVPFVFLPVMGTMASTRRLGHDWVKLFIMGNKAGAGHTHEDKGHFVLEFAGDTFAMDSGTCDYSSPYAGLAQNCERHNMLIPYGTAERPHPQSPLPADVKPVGAGDATRFRATVSLAAGWETYYRQWTRTWESPTPDVLTITDEYDLLQGEGVDFCWLTRLEVAITGQTALIRGRRGRAELTFPAACELRLDDLPFFGGTVHRRLVARQPGTRGCLTVTVRLSSV